MLDPHGDPPEGAGAAATEVLLVEQADTPSRIVVEMVHKRI